MGSNKEEVHLWKGNKIKKNQRAPNQPGGSSW